MPTPDLSSYGDVSGPDLSQYGDVSHPSWDIQKEANPQGFWTDFANNVLPHTIIGKLGGTNIAHGIQGLASGGSIPGSIADIGEGVSTLALPFVAPEMSNNPIRTIAGLIGGIGGGVLGRVGASLFGAGPEATRLTGDITGLAGGTAGYGLTPEGLPELFSNPKVRALAISKLPAGYLKSILEIHKALSEGEEPEPFRPGQLKNIPKFGGPAAPNYSAPSSYRVVGKGPGIAGPLTPQTNPIQPIASEGGSPVPPNAPSFKHDAPYTDLNRSWHTNFPEEMRATIGKIFGRKPGPDGKYPFPTYQELQQVHEFRMQNNGKIPTAKDLAGK